MTTTVHSPTSPAPTVPTDPGPLKLTWLHTRFNFLETIRIPIAVIGTLVFPALSMLFFVVPMREVANNPQYATEATVGLCFFAVMANCLFSFGVGVAEDRARPWDPFLRTLPVGSAPRIGARLLNGLLWSLLSLVPVLAVAVLLTEATITPGRMLASAGVLAIGALPFLFGGLAIGYRLPAKAALAVAQVAMFGMAFAGGLFLPPSMFPHWLDTFSAALPSRSGRDLLAWSSMGGDLPVTALITWAVWSAVTFALAAAAYRRDEGVRFR